MLCTHFDNLGHHLSLVNDTFAEVVSYSHNPTFVILRRRAHGRRNTRESLSMEDGPTPLAPGRLSSNLTHAELELFLVRADASPDSPQCTDGTLRSAPM